MAVEVKPRNLLRAIQKLLRKRETRRQEYTCGYLALISARAEGVELLIDRENSPGQFAKSEKPLKKEDYLEPPDWVRRRMDSLAKRVEQPAEAADSADLSEKQ